MVTEFSESGQMNGLSPFDNDRENAGGCPDPEVQMRRILVLGAAPLPFEPRERQYAPNLRTWHLTKPLIGDGHEVRVIAGRLPNTYPDDVPPILERSDMGFGYLSVEGALFQDDAWLQAQLEAFQPEAVVGVNTHPSSRAVALDTDRPIWCDLNGWIMAEGQAKCRVYDDDRFLSHFWKMERDILDRADVISTVSRAQAFATIGELATRGRLGTATFGYSFVHTIPNAIVEIDYAPSGGAVRGRMVPEDAFVVLWTGGYNTWTDVDLLFGALERAMRAVPDLHFVSTGGVIEGHDELTFTRFRQCIDASEMKERFHLAGWVPTADVPAFYTESDLGINVDSSNYETTFGARNRLNEWLKVGLPILTTLGTEISETLAELDLCLRCGTQDAEGFAERMIWAARNRDEIRDMAERARGFAVDRFSYARTTEPLREWARQPKRAPDEGRRVPFRDVDFYREEGEVDHLRSRLKDLQTRCADLEEAYHQTKHELGDIHHSTMWRVWMGLIALRRVLTRPFKVFRKGN